MNFPVFSQLAGKLAVRDGFARDCPLQRRVRSDPGGISRSARQRQAILDQAADQMSFLRLAETLIAFPPAVTPVSGNAGNR